MALSECEAVSVGLGWQVLRIHARQPTIRREKPSRNSRITVKRVKSEAQNKIIEIRALPYFFDGSAIAEFATIFGARSGAVPSARAFLPRN